MVKDEDILTMTDDEVIDVHGNLAHHIVRKYYGKSLQDIKRNTNMEYEDLVQLGYIGLLKAKKDFDPRGGAKFSTYASMKMLGELSTALRKFQKIKVSRPLFDAQLYVHNNNMKDSPAAEIAEKLGISLRMAKEAKNYNSYCQSFEQPIATDKDGDALFLGDMLEDESAYNSYMAVEIDELVGKFLNTLSEQDKTVWFLYYREGKRQSEISKMLGLSQSYVSRIITRVERKANDYGKRLGLQGG